MPSNGIKSSKQKAGKKVSHHCPSELAMIIRLVNFLPSYFNGSSIQRFQAIVEELDDSYTAEYDRRFRDKSIDDALERQYEEFLLNLIEQLRGELRTLFDSEELLDYLIQETFCSDTWSLALRRFRQLVDSQSVLLSVARKLVYKDGFVESAITGQTGWVYLGMDEDGILRLRLTDLMKVFSENDIIGSKIRECSRCGKIFWAKRKDTKTCSKPCYDALKMKGYREAKREQINRTRRATYRRKKEREAIRAQSKAYNPSSKSTGSARV